MNRPGNRTEITHDFFLRLNDKVSKSGGQVRPSKGEYESVVLYYRDSYDCYRSQGFGMEK